MCGIYGVLSYKNKLKNINNLVDVLGKESTERGMDATGIAYVQNGRIKINKNAINAYKFKPDVPKSVKAVIGHTRHSTQGDKSKNYNNHPWCENVRNCQFALAHNGFLTNDFELKKKYNFSNKVKTDSFVAVQLLKMQNKLDFESIKFMAESIRGSFSFNLLDSDNNIYLVKGDSPISILHFKNAGVYVFASTDHILWRALIASEMFVELQRGNYEEILLNEGDILKITSEGKLETSNFTYTYSFGRMWYEFDSPRILSYEDGYLEDMKAIAAMSGIEPETIDELLDEGFTFEEIEDMIYYGQEM